MKYQNGTKFKTRGKHPKVCTVVDMLSTYDRAGKLVHIRYVATHEFLGQTVTDRDVLGTTIARGLITTNFGLTHDRSNGSKTDA